MMVIALDTMVNAPVSNNARAMEWFHTATLQIMALNTRKKAVGATPVLSVHRMRL